MELSEYTRIISSEIKTPDGVDAEAVAKEILDLYVTRTKEHIKSVKEYARKACAFLDKYDWFSLFKANAVMHDHDKLDDEMFMAHYAPYVVKRYCADGLNDKFEVTEAYKKLWDNYYVVQHCKNNPHHAESWDKTYNYGENNPPYNATEMPPECLAEMVCDWCAVGREQGDDPMNWFKKVNGQRFVFTEQQQKFIRTLIEEIR